MQKNNFILLSMILFFTILIGFLIFQNNFVNAQVATFCAERTTFGGSCLDVPIDQVNLSFPYAQTACASTTFCQTGTCVNTKVGTCSSAPKATCDPTQGGIWYSSTPQATPVCSFGCCIIGDQASFTTKAGCQTLFSLYGNGSFNANTNNEADCLASAQPLAKGACVYETDSGRTCRFTTKQDCQGMTGLNTTFYQNDLCTNPDLGTNCVIPKNPTTTCLNGQDQVFFVDSCGNPANVYDSGKITDTNYWSYVPGINGVTISLDSNLATESPTNGNCNYFLGSTCMQYNSQDDPAKPQFGNYICRSLDCKSPSDTFASLFQGVYGKYPQNGETWCGTETANSISVDSSGNGNPNGNPGLTGSASSIGVGLDLSTITNNNLPGSTEVLFTCANGKITTQVDADGRNKVCVQSVSSNNFVSAQFVVNEWQNCYYQNSSADCSNLGDCQWVVGASILKDSNGQPMVYDTEQDLLVPQANSTDTRPGASCVPKYSPGFDNSVNSSQTSQQSICGLASYTCYANYEKSPTGSWSVNSTITCLNNDENYNTTWTGNMKNLCSSLGDCGMGPDYVGTNGANTQGDLFKKVITNSSGATLHL